jgi:hypothetical protein
VAARTSYAVAALVALTVASVALLVALGGRAADLPPRPVRSPEPAPAAVLAGWDRQRAEAWAGGDADALAALYTPGSPSGDRDVRMLRRYLARDLRVEGLRTQRLVVVVVEHAERRLVLRVRDRVVGGTVRGPGVSVRLPRDRVSGHLVTLERVGGTWLVAHVAPAGAGRPRASVR